MTDHADTNGFVSVASEHSVDYALSKLETELRARGITIGQTWLSRNSERYLQARHHLPESLLPNIVIEALVSQAAT